MTAMPTPSQLFGPAPTTREGWADALLALAAPATRTAAAGPGRMPVHASMSDHRAVWFELVARPCGDSPRTPPAACPARTGSGRRRATR